MRLPRKLKFTRNDKKRARSAITGKIFHENTLGYMNNIATTAVATIFKYFISENKYIDRIPCQS